MKPILLFQPVQAYKALMDAWPWIKSMLMAGHRLVLTITLERRTGPQNRHFHALAGRLAKSDVMWGGKRRKQAAWKVLLVSGHAKATGEEFDLIAGLEGEFVNLRESTALMSKKRSSSLVEYTIAFCEMNGVPTLWRDDDAEQE